MFYTARQEGFTESSQTLSFTSHPAITVLITFSPFYVLFLVLISSQFTPPSLSVMLIPGKYSALSVWPVGCVLLLLGLLPVRQPVDPPGQRHRGSTSLLSCQAWDGQIVRILAGGGRWEVINIKHVILSYATCRYCQPGLLWEAGWHTGTATR